MNYDLKDISKVTKKENKQQQQQQHGSHANSSSHTLTEAEMKEGVDYYTTMTTERGTSSLIILYSYNYYYIDVVIGKPTNIEIFRGNQPLGITLCGGYQVLNIPLTL